MKILSMSASRYAVMTALAAAAMAGSTGAQGGPLPPGNYYGVHGNPHPRMALSRWDRLRFDRSGTRGREGLGATPGHPEGPGNVSD